jgi:hypothetical protein
MDDSGKHQQDFVSFIELGNANREIVMAALGRITGSPPFQSSKQACKFLQYIVERTLAGELDYLKERSIGSVLFGRPSDYDTGADSIVRVTAMGVRKRLIEYYQSAGRDESVIFELPPGNYRPEIRLSSNRVHSGPAEESPTIPVNAERKRSVAAFAYAGWACALVASVIAAWGMYGRQSGPPRTTERTLPWSVLFSGNQPVQLVMADSAMGVLSMLSHDSVSLEAYANRWFLKEPGNLPPELRAPWQRIARREYTSVADARIAAAYSVLAKSAGRELVVRFARDLQLTDFWRGDNMVLLGSTASNPWVELYQNDLDFQIGRTSELPTPHIKVRNPQRGEPDRFVGTAASGSTGEAYALLSFTRGLGGKGAILIAQGTSMECTELAANMAMNQEAIQAALPGCKLKGPDACSGFEIVWELRLTASSVRQSRVVAVRCRPAR